MVDFDLTVTSGIFRATLASAGSNITERGNGLMFVWVKSENAMKLYQDTGGTWIQVGANVSISATSAHISFWYNGTTVGLAVDSSLVASGTALNLTGTRVAISTMFGPDIWSGYLDNYVVKELA